MKKQEQEEKIAAIIKQDPRFKRNSYIFVGEAVEFTIARQKQVAETPRHISGGELLNGIRDFALQQFGPLALDVLQDWGVNSCEDFGSIVFNMVKHQLLGASEEDSEEDFKGGFDFHDAFLKPFAVNHTSPPAPPHIA